MSEQSAINMSRGLPETVLPPWPKQWTDALESARATSPADRRQQVAKVAAAFPKLLDAWAELAELARDDIEMYAYARVGYHRGLDALRAAGWRGTGFVRWRDPSNRGFLLCVKALGVAAGRIGELDEAERCRVFLYQLDPEWARAESR